MVGSNPSITPEVVDVLIGEPGNPVCETLAANPSCPPYVLTLLGTRDCLHDDTTEGCTCRYDGEVFEVVLSAVLANPSAPPQLRSDLRGFWTEMFPGLIPPENPPDDWQCVRAGAAGHDDPGEAAACGFALAETDPDTQMLWARHRCDEVRRDLALNLAAHNAHI